MERLLERRERLRLLGDFIESTLVTEKEISEDRLIAAYCVRWGMSRRIILEYLSILQYTIGFTRNKGIIKREPKEAQKELTKQEGV